MNDSKQLYYELSFYTLAHTAPSFIHQHIVDAFTAQTADENTKPISLIFSLAGLYLYLEKGFTGRQVQKFHLQMAKDKREWPTIVLPANRGTIDVSHVLAAAPGPGRDSMIYQWCASVWGAYKANRDAILALLKADL